MDRDDGPARHGLRRLIFWFDTVDHEWAARALTRAVARAGRLLLARPEFGPEHPVAVTVAAAEAYLSHPSERNRLRYFAAATRSYPYGAGEGCYRVEGAADCGPGSGCRTGAGTLERIADVVGADAVRGAVHRR
ncbi:hypothetical protein Val02_35150 [Virgisporangium aliadipatigenens]|uniref:Uncharacterized protein n=1 Tax=Virgisporangium aliadipatigenens TaxID=741659 RepID=A0A8J4DQH9_9ACTN|nr:hypothetical protein [Virgisporangium aliadipatigenens]GIJ46629.1 hypothetical protein Val02_35150 [Virgisporangium aliadipatigenens]